MQARRQGSTSSGVKHQASPYDKQALVAALSWQHASLSDKNVEGSATSDEDHPRCAYSFISWPAQTMLMGSLPAVLQRSHTGSPDPTGRAWHACNDPKHAQYVYPACSWGGLHGRLVPRRGAGPELRSSGREIDEYLMRLLHAGSTDASQDVEFRNLVRLHPL